MLEIQPYLNDGVHETGVAQVGEAAEARLRLLRAPAVVVAGAAAAGVTRGDGAHGRRGRGGHAVGGGGGALLLVDGTRGGRVGQDATGADEKGR